MIVVDKSPISPFAGAEVSGIANDTDELAPIMQPISKTAALACLSIGAEFPTGARASRRVEGGAFANVFDARDRLERPYTQTVAGACPLGASRTIRQRQALSFTGISHSKIEIFSKTGR